MDVFKDVFKDKLNVYYFVEIILNKITYFLLLYL